jgi:aminopeptidase N
MMPFMRPVIAFLLACTMSACPAATVPTADAGTVFPDAGAGAPDGGEPADGGVNRSVQDVLTTALTLDLATRTGTARIRVQPAAGSQQVTLQTGMLMFSSSKVDGAAVQPLVEHGFGHWPIPRSDQPVELEVSYVFPARSIATFDGWLADKGITFTWPFACGNLFPCNPLPWDGVTFSMEVTGIPEGQRALYPRSTVTDAPAYMPAVAVGPFEEVPLGTTDAGTRVAAYYLPSLVTEATARAGTAHLLQVQEYFEQAFGPYPFGTELGAVSVDWGPGQYGGIELQPYYHVPYEDFGTEEVHAHEAAHAWFGNGVRFACWEDFVLSEGTVTYMAARGLEKAGGPDVWPMYVDELTLVCNGAGNTVVLQDATCNTIDFLNEWSLAHYMKGACFYEEVADLIGWDAVDEVIRDFFLAHVNGAARMQQMVEALKAKAGPANAPKVQALEVEWLRRLACPTNYAARCGMHGPR